MRTIVQNHDHRRLIQNRHKKTPIPSLTDFLDQLCAEIQTESYENKSWLQEFIIANRVLIHCQAFMTDEQIHAVIEMYDKIHGDKMNCESCEMPTPIHEMKRLHGQTLCLDCFSTKADGIHDLLGRK